MKSCKTVNVSVISSLVTKTFPQTWVMNDCQWQPGYISVAQQRRALENKATRGNMNHCSFKTTSFITTRGQCSAWDLSVPAEHHVASSVHKTCKKNNNNKISRKILLVTFSLIGSDQDKMWLRTGCDSKMRKCWRVFTSPGVLAKSLHWSSLTFITSRPLRKLNRIDHYWGAEECWDTKKGQRKEEKPGRRKPEAGDEEIYSWQPVKPISLGPQWHNGTGAVLAPRPGQRGGHFDTTLPREGTFPATPAHPHLREFMWLMSNFSQPGQRSEQWGSRVWCSDKLVVPTQTFIQCRAVREQEERRGGILQGSSGGSEWYSC